MRDYRGSAHAFVSRTGGALRASGEGAAAALIRKQAQEIDDLWDRLSRACARSPGVPTRDDPRGDGGAPGYARRATATPDERLKPGLRAALAAIDMIAVQRDRCSAS